MIARIAVLLFALSASGAEAHDYWSDGKPVPDWVKASCCGPADAHHLRPEQVHRASDDYYTIDGYVRRIPVGQALPSQDGDYWIFYRDDGGVEASPGSTASSCRWISDARSFRDRHMRGQTRRDRERHVDDNRGVPDGAQGQLGAVCAHPSQSQRAFELAAPPGDARRAPAP